MLVAPALLLGAFVYWTLALGLGAVSLSGVRSLEQADLQLMMGAGCMTAPEQDEESPVPADGTSDMAQTSQISIDGTEGETIAVDVVGNGPRDDGPAQPTH